ncbi:EamA family transporter [uncultured Jatrophihabitans sp.]|uniref:EamA family transporter n=1 Tax=uncultured Jatrophihabitans sp. TaxID=1610747 RepID=UPI0035C9BB65
MSSAAITAAVAGAGLLHASWNAVAHRLDDKAISFALMGVVDVLFGLVVAFALPLPACGAWPYLLASVVVHTGYTMLLIRAYQLGDFTQMYPIARGVSPLIVGVVAVTVVGQHLDAVQLAGLAVVCAGLACVAFGGGRVNLSDRPALLAAVATGGSIATYTVLDGVGVRHAHGSLGYTGWLFLLFGPVFPIAVIAGRGLRRTVEVAQPVLVPGLVSGVVGLAAYGIVIWAQTRSNLAAVSATRERSILFGALIGTVLFKERFGAWRIAGAGLTVVGILAINL